jgi:hypothetical protein
VQSAPGVSVNELARAGRFAHLQISVTTLDVLLRDGFELVFPALGGGVYHATVRVQGPLPPEPLSDAKRRSCLMFRIYFDENERDNQGRFDLGIPGSLRDLEPLTGELVDGLHIILYEDGSLELEAILEFEPKYNVWMAHPLWDTLRRFEVQKAPPAAVK